MSDTVQPEHFVQFYENDAHIASSVATFAGRALAAGNRALVIATPERRSAISDVLLARGVNWSSAAQREQFVVLDAAATLEKFMVDGSPDARLFHETVGPLVARLTDGGRTLRAFGEMVALLAMSGNQKGAIELEDLWNELRKQYSFTLFCAYPMGHFSGIGDAEVFDHICGRHTRVVQPVSYAGHAPRPQS